jgi:hypothetical protein
MGRPLNKKYFGNRNIGSASVTTDDKLGGQGLGVYALDAQLGTVAINNTYKYFPTLTIPAPTYATGTQATVTVVWEINTVTIAGGTGYSAGLITSISGLTAQASVAPIFSVTEAGGVPTFSNFTDTGASRGEFTLIDGTAITTWAVVQGAANNAQATITFRVKSITTLEQGSGYTTVPTLVWARGSSQSAGGQTAVGAPTVALAVDTGSVGTATYQENAITAYAFTGSSVKIADIVRQVSTDRYKVATADTTIIAKLKTDGAAAAEGEMTISATDSTGKTYYVKKLTARKAVLVPYGTGPGATGHEFPLNADGTPQRVQWLLSDAVLNTSVKIDNA